MWQSGGAGRERFGICMRREGPLGGDCLVCVVPADSRQAGSGISAAREGDLNRSIGGCLHVNISYEASSLQQVRVLQNVSIEEQIAILKSVITPLFWML